MTNAFSPLFCSRFCFCLVSLIWAWLGLPNFYTEFQNSWIMQIYANLCKKNDTVLLYFPANLLHLFLFCLSDSVLVVVPSRPTQNSEIHYLFNLSNLPKTSMKSAASLFCSGFSFCLYYLIGFGCSFQISKKNSEFLFFLEGSEIVKLKWSNPFPQLCTFSGVIYYTQHHFACLFVKHKTF